MHGAGHLLVEQGRAGGAVDAGVGADPELAEEARAGVGGQRGLEVVLAARGAGRRHLAVLERELDVRDEHAARARGDREADRPVGRVLERAGEDLAARHVAPAVGVDPGAAVDARAAGRFPRPRCGSRAPRQPLDERLPGVATARARPRPGRGGRGTARARRTPRSRRRSCRPAGRAPASARACRTSACPAAPPGRLAGARRRGRSVAGSMPASARVLAGASIRR